MPTPVVWFVTPVPCQDPGVSSALQCLEASATEDPYTQALLAYVFGLAGRGEQRQARLQSLAQHSVSAGITPCPGHPTPPPSPGTPGAGD